MARDMGAGEMPHILRLRPTQMKATLLGAEQVEKG